MINYLNNIPSGTQTPGTISITWMGIAGLYISDGEESFFIDPCVNRFNILSVGLGLPLRGNETTVDRWLSRQKIHRSSAIFISHSHFDHAIDAHYFSHKTGAPVFGSRCTSLICQSGGIPKEKTKVISYNEPIHVGKFTITPIESLHGPALFGRIPYKGNVTEPFSLPAPVWQYKLGQVFSFLVEHPGGSFIHHGSAGFKEEMYHGIEADVIFLGIAGRGNTEKYLEETLLASRADRLVPIHWDNMFRPLEKSITPMPLLNIGEFNKTIDIMGLTENTVFIHRGVSYDLNRLRS
jgi:L-ascorbate metabolism protein UlaG (beta-lactamase superfamily)